MNNLSKIFVANLPWTVGKRELQRHFEKFGPLIFVHISYDWTTGISKGFGFVKFKNSKDHEKAIKEPQQILDGGLIFVKETLD